MKRYVKPKCTHAFILHLFPMIKSLPKVLILYSSGHFIYEFPNLYLRFFTIQTNQSLNHGLLSSKPDQENPWANKTTISIAHNLVLHDRMKHVEVKKHFIKEKLEIGLICMPYIPIAKQIANLLTKGIPKKQFVDLIGKLAMEDIFKPA